jgi:hypothetical protein
LPAEFGVAALNGMATVLTQDEFAAAKLGSVADVSKSNAMALDEIADRIARISSAFRTAGVPYSLVGGQAVSLWVATTDPAAVRTTNDVDILLERADLGRARSAARTVEMDYFETMGVRMFLDQRDPNPCHAVHIVWASELVRPGDVVTAPTIDDCTRLPGGYEVVSLPKLVEMKLMAGRDQDRVHLRDLIGVGLVGRELVDGLPSPLSAVLAMLLDEQGG